MTKIARKTAKQFAVGAGGSGVSEFGAIAGGAANYSFDLDVLQSSDFEVGWLNAVVAGSKRLPPYEDMNAVQFVFSTQIAYLLQEGVPEYDSGTEYHQNSIVKEAGTYKFYGSKTNTNSGNALTDTANWGFLFDGSMVRNYYTDSGSANAYVASAFPAGAENPSGYVEGMVVKFYPDNTNTSTSTINVSSLGSKAIKDADGNALAGGEIVAGKLLELIYDGTDFRITSPNPVLECKGWVSFEDNPAVVLKKTGIISSVSRIATGQYRVTFSDVGHTNYHVSLGAVLHATQHLTMSEFARTSTTVDLRILQYSSGTQVDLSASEQASIGIFA